MDIINRSTSDRRSGKDRRRVLSLQRFFFKAKNRRMRQRRANPLERREGWVKLDKWSSARLTNLKIAKYLKR